MPVQRSIITSGGSDHIELVKLASKKIIDEFDYLQEILIQYERTDIRADVKLSEKWYHRTNVSLEMRPDIMVVTGEPKEDKGYGRYIGTNQITIVEAETDPRNIFKNIFKIEVYKKMKAKAQAGMRDPVTFILVCFEDAKLPKDTAPFDIWKFPRLDILEENIDGSIENDG